MARAIIAGCGSVGVRLGGILAGEGHEVVGIRRHTASLPSFIRPLRADLADSGALSDADLYCDWAVYSSAADDSSDAAYEAAYVRGLRNFLDQLRAGAPAVRRVLFTSSTGVYGQDDGGWVDEDSPTEPAAFTGRRVLEGERLLLASGLPAIVLRFGGIYGPGRRSFLDRVRSGGVGMSKGPVYTNRIHLEDCARSIRFLLTLENPRTIYNGVDRDPADRNEVIGWLCDRLGSPRPVFDPDSPVAATGKRCSSDRLVEAGYEFAYPTYREGYGETIARGTGA